MGMLRTAASFLAAMLAALLPSRWWHRLPASFEMVPASFASGAVFFFLAAAIGIPGFLEHAGLLVSASNAALLKVAAQQIAAGISDSDPKAVRFENGMNALAVFTFLLMTPKGWVTTYLGSTGALRMAAAWFGDPIGDPVLTALDGTLWRSRGRAKATRARRSREALEGPEIPDRVVTGATAGIPGCDLVIVSSRRKDGWAKNVVVFTATTCYRIGEPVERTVAGNLRTLYPLTRHTDLEAVRKSVNYDMPA